MTVHLRMKLATVCLSALCVCPLNVWWLAGCLPAFLPACLSVCLSVCAHLLVAQVDCCLNSGLSLWQTLCSLRLLMHLPVRCCDFSAMGVQTKCESNGLTRMRLLCHHATNDSYIIHACIMIIVIVVIIIIIIIINALGVMQRE